MKLEQHQAVFYKNIGTYMALINNELKKSYPLEPLSNHIKMVGGYTFKSSHYLSEGVPIIRISDFKNERIDLTGVKYYEQSSNLDRYELNAGDVIIAMTGGTIGKLAIVQEGLGKLYLNQRVGKFQVLNPNEFEDEYVYWLARGIQVIVQNLGYGGAQPNVSNKQLEALEFAFPERNIQKQIIDFLNDLKDNKIKRKYFNSDVENKILQLQNESVKLHSVKNDAVLNESFIAKLKNAILQEAVQGKLTAVWRANNTNIENVKIDRLEKLRRAYQINSSKIKGQKSFKYKESVKIDVGGKSKGIDSLFEIPKSWAWVSLGQIAWSINDGPHFSPKYVDEGVPMISGRNISFENGIDFTSAKYVSAHDHLEYTKRGQPEVGDVLLTKGGTTGVPCVVETTKEFSVWVHVALIKLVKEFIDPYYLKMALASPFVYRQSQEQTHGIGNKDLGLTRMIFFAIPLPPFEEQKAIVQKVNALMGLCNELEQLVNESQVQCQKLVQSVLLESLEVNSSF